jgi:curved DNA-binding protein CbpA
LKLHPDKNPDKPDAATIFHRLVKAYDLLSDEKAKEA